ncbi:MULTISPECIES: WecB/TagA/CpsF family glycosyltransferase [Actinomadura]|uniref:WecB/TagA/CpsF family glycosyltransferase n=2 Tax=Actinomadura yumaensis TaxID=111807 RepID=A0ABW2CDK8_9ACTN|nr:WecB/TagA/CpsF family glycosyltransferase [Actinomadura sp. J1-007]
MNDDTIGERRRFLGVWLAPLTLEESVALCVKAVEERSAVRVGCVNAAKIVKMRDDARLREAVLGCDLVVADGQSVVWAGRVLDRPLPERVAGIDLMTALLPEAERHGHSVYFLGAREDVLQDMLAAVRRRYPGLRIAGHRNGYFDQEEEAAVADAVRASGADMLFIGTSSPKKELFVHHHGERTGASLVHGVGGSFDVLAGKVRRAPEFWRRNGLEWLYRAVQEPMRLGPRYLTTNTAFLLMLGREFLLRRLPPRRK